MRYLIHLFHDEPLVLEIIGLVLCASSFWPGLPESVGQKGPWAGWFLGKCRRGWRTGKVPQKPLAGRGVTYQRWSRDFICAHSKMEYLLGACFLRFRHCGDQAGLPSERAFDKIAS